MDKRKQEKMKNTLTSAQEVTYNREFKAADRVAGYNSKRIK
ncbi:YfhE family protein [Falsibacillus albus]|uniref:YfhE family protein n=1 Tax=Falsibacillus albus TaxID=2478915 RepID=A0A3L7JQT1_9BACI|nr:YfhE family protein [Falsibacillus albus]RLQ92429.1 YfhE family protein [Falsibacillus albus]